MSDTVAKDLRITTDPNKRSVFELEGVWYSETGLTLPSGLPYKVWEEMMGTLGRLGRGIQWAIGDAINYGERTYGEVYTQAIDATGYNYNTLANFAWVARVFPPTERRTTLYFDHHSAVAWLYQERRDVANEILDLAVEGQLSVKEVRNDVREAKRELGIEEPVMPPDEDERSPRQRSGGVIITEEGEVRDTRTPITQERPEHPLVQELKGVDEMMDEMLDLLVRVAVASPPELLNLQQEAITWLHNHGLAGELYARQG